MFTCCFPSGVCFTNICLTLHSMFTLNGDVVTVTTPSDCRWLQVELQPHGGGRGGDGEKEEDRRRIKVPATGNMVSCAADATRSPFNHHVFLKTFSDV